MRKAIKDIKLIIYLIFREGRIQSGLGGLGYVYIQLAAELRCRQMWELKKHFSCSYIDITMTEEVDIWWNADGWT